MRMFDHLLVTDNMLHDSSSYKIFTNDFWSTLNLGIERLLKEHVGLSPEQFVQIVSSEFEASVPSVDWNSGQTTVQTTVSPSGEKTWLVHRYLCASDRGRVLPFSGANRSKTSFEYDDRSGALMLTAKVHAGSEIEAQIEFDELAAIHRASMPAFNRAIERYNAAIPFILEDHAASFVDDSGHVTPTALSTYLNKTPKSTEMKCQVLYT